VLLNALAQLGAQKLQTRVSGPLVAGDAGVWQKGLDLLVVPSLWYALCALRALSVVVWLVGLSRVPVSQGVSAAVARLCHQCRPRLVAAGRDTQRPARGRNRHHHPGCGTGGPLMNDSTRQVNRMLPFYAPPRSTRTPSPRSPRCLRSGWLASGARRSRNSSRSCRTTAADGRCAPRPPPPRAWRWRCSPVAIGQGG